MSDEEKNRRGVELPSAPETSIVPGRAVDWTAAAALPSFRELTATRNRFIAPALLLSAGFYLAVTLFVGFAPDIAARPVIGAINVGYLLIFAVYLVTWASAVLYVRFSGAVLDSKAASVVNEIRAQEDRACKG